MCNCVTACACGCGGGPLEPEEKTCGGEVLASAVSLGILGALLGPVAAVAGAILGAGLAASACKIEQENQERIGR